MRKKKSIIVDDMEHCKLCGSPYVEIHHCLHGTANRKKADKYNLVIPLCHEHHTGGKQSAHLNARYDLMYKKMAQKAFEEKIGTREEFGCNIYDSRQTGRIKRLYTIMQD